MITKPKVGMWLGMFRGMGGSASPSGGAKQSFSDNFDRADNDSLGANWTEVVGDCDILSNVFDCATADSNNIAYYSGIACSTVSQYICATVLGASTSASKLFIFRHTPTGTAYVINFEMWNEVMWYKAPTLGGTWTQIGVTLALTVDHVDKFGITVDGTGANTDIRIWRNPTANTPISATEWDSGDTTPDASWTTTDPGANAVDTGGYLGLGGYKDGANINQLEGFYGGDIP